MQSLFSPNRSIRPVKTRPFTLLELLVVVLVMLVLVGMLLPSLVKSRETAKRVNCTTNLKQIGLALRSYSIDAREWFPSPYPSTTKSTDSLEDMAGLDRLVSGLYLTADKIYNCPSSADETWIDADNHVVGLSYLYVVDDIGPLSEGHSETHSALSADRRTNDISPSGESKYGNVLLADGSVNGYHGSTWWEDEQIAESMRTYIAK